MESASQVYIVGFEMYSAKIRKSLIMKINCVGMGWESHGPYSGVRGGDRESDRAGE